MRRNPRIRKKAIVEAFEIYYADRLLTKRERESQGKNAFQTREEAANQLALDRENCGFQFGSAFGAPHPRIDAIAQEILETMSIQAIFEELGDTVPASFLKDELDPYFTTLIGQYNAFLHKASYSDLKELPCFFADLYVIGESIINRCERAAMPDLDEESGGS